jgi:hypothetical protein
VLNQDPGTARRPVTLFNRGERIDGNAEGDGDLANQYAGHIMQVYSQYRWRQSVQAQQGKPSWEGLADDDKWQIGAPGSNAAVDKRRLRELDFWFGTPGGG